MARYDLQLPEDEVGELTLAEFDALVQRKRAEDNRLRLNAGVVAATIQNCTPGDPQQGARVAAGLRAGLGQGPHAGPASDDAGAAEGTHSGYVRP